MGTTRHAGGGILAYGFGRDTDAISNDQTLGALNQSYTDGIKFEEFTTTGGDTFTGISIEKSGRYRILSMMSVSNFNNLNAQIRKSTTWPATTGAVDSHGSVVMTGRPRDYFLLFVGEFSSGEKVWTVANANNVENGAYEVYRLA